MPDGTSVGLGGSLLLLFFEGTSEKGFGFIY
jgi:hypothetical protein